MFRQLPFIQWLLPRQKADAPPEQTPPTQPRQDGAQTPPSQASRPPKRPSSITLADVLRELDISALRLLSGHLEAAGCRGQARSTCRALRDAVDAGQTHVKLQLSLTVHSSQPGPKPLSPLAQKPCCTSVHLVLRRAAQQTDKQPEAGAQPEPGAAEDLLAWPFEGLPAPRRQQITRLALSTTELGARPECIPNLPRVLARLGALLPAIQHLDISDCYLYNWLGWDRSDQSHIYSTLAAAFPSLTSLAVDGLTADHGQLVQHVGDRLEELQLGSAVRSEPWEPLPELQQQLPLLWRLRRLVTVGAQWDHEGWSSDEEDAQGSDSDDPWQGFAESDDEPMGEGEGGGGGVEQGGAGGLAEGGGLAVGVQAAAGADAAGVEQQAAAVGGGAEVGQQGAGEAPGAGQGGVGEGGQFAMDAGQEGNERPSGRFTRFLRSLPPALEELSMRDVYVHTGEGVAVLPRGRGLEVSLQGGKAQRLRVGWTAKIVEVRRVEAWVRAAGLGPEGEAGRIPLLEVEGLKEGDVWTLNDGRPVEFLRQRFDRVDIGTLHLWTHVVEPALADLTVYYRPQVVQMQGMRVRVRACGGLSLRPGESREQYDELERKHLQQQQRMLQQQQQFAGVGRRVDVAALVRQGCAQYLEEGLDFSYVDAEAVAREAFGPLREALGAAVEAAARATAVQPGASSKGGKEKGKSGGGCGGGCGGGGGSRDAKGQKKSRVGGKVTNAGAEGGGGGGIATVGSLEGAGCSGGGVSREAKADCGSGGVGGVDEGTAGGEGATAGAGAVRLPGLAVVHAKSCERSHRLVLLGGPFFAVLGDGALMNSWLHKMRDKGHKVKDAWEGGPGGQDGGSDADGDGSWRYLRLPGRKGGGAESSSVYVVVECSSAKEAAQLCAAAAAAAAADPGGCLRAVRLAGASLQEAVFRPCMASVSAWGACGARGRCGVSLFGPRAAARHQRSGDAE